MHIEHVALWVADLERSRAFYESYFGGLAGARYVNPRTGFASYFVTFDGSARLELMQRSDVTGVTSTEHIGWAHIAFSVGSREAVDALTERLRADGYTILSGPRTTGDGCYESVVLDPDGARVEITI